MKSILGLTCTLFLLGLSACSGILKPFVDEVPVGTEITLNKEIRIPDNLFSVIIQNGEIRKKYNQYYPYCEFSILRKGKNFRNIHPDTFRVIKVGYEELASNRPALYASVDSSFGYTGYKTYTTILYLSSAHQPQVYQLECSVWQIPTEAELLTRVDMQKTLGKLFTIGK